MERERGGAVRIVDALGFIEQAVTVSDLSAKATRSPNLAVYIASMSGTNSFLQTLLDAPEVDVVLIDASTWMTNELRDMLAGTDKPVAVRYGFHHDPNPIKVMRQIEENGAISLGASVVPLDVLLREISGILSTNGGLKSGLSEAVRRFYVPIMGVEEYCNVLNVLEKGGILEVGAYIYADHSKWRAIRQSPEYSPLANSTEKVDVDAIPHLVNAVRERGLDTIVSMGPSPDVDKELLLTLARQSRKVKYMPVDVNRSALEQTLDSVSEYLTAQYGAGWEEFIAMESPRPMNFSDASPMDKALIMYCGGTIVNYPSFLDQAAKLCQGNSVLFADTHLCSSGEDHSDFWMSKYDIEPERDMFRSGIHYLMPSLFNPENIGKWDIGVEYIHSPDGNNRVSFQLRVFEELSTFVHGVPVTLEPGITRELMISTKSTEDFFRQRYEGLGFVKLGETRADIEDSSSGPKGLCYGVILAKGDTVQYPHRSIG
jgi:hypothetical protein